MNMKDCTVIGIGLLSGISSGTIDKKVILENIS